MKSTTSRRAAQAKTKLQQRKVSAALHTCVSRRFRYWSFSAFPTTSILSQQNHAGAADISPAERHGEPERAEPARLTTFKYRHGHWGKLQSQIWAGPEQADPWKHQSWSCKPSASFELRSPPNPNEKHLATCKGNSKYLSKPAGRDSEAGSQTHFRRNPFSSCSSTSARLRHPQTTWLKTTCTHDKGGFEHASPGPRILFFFSSLHLLRNQVIYSSVVVVVAAGPAWAPLLGLANDGLPVVRASAARRKRTQGACRWALAMVDDWGGGYWEQWASLDREGAG